MAKAKTKYTRIHRLLKIITLVQSRRDCTAPSLAEDCGVNERTVFRDLTELKGAGIPVRFDDATGAYRIERDFFMPPVHLAVDEALALAVLCEEIAKDEQIAFTAPAWKALTKIKAALPAPVRDEIDRIIDAVVIRTAQAMPADGFGSVFDAVQQAIALKRALRCRYDSLNSSNASEEFDFEPYALFFSVRAWYAVGHHGGRNEVRTLKLNRFEQTTLTHRPYSVPPDFSLDAHLGNAWRMIRGTEDHEVEVWFDPSFAETMSDTQWHPTQDIEFHDDGSATFRATVSGLDEILWWVLSMGPHCKVIKPKALRDRVRNAADGIRAHYAD